VITKERMGLTPIKVDIPDTQEGKTFGILYKDYRNVALMIYKPAPTAREPLRIVHPLWSQALFRENIPWV
jgi:hypothetical protein